MELLDLINQNHPDNNQELSIDAILKELEIRLREDNDFLNKKVNDILETNADPKLMDDLLELATFANKYVEYVILKKDRSALSDDKMGDIWEGMSLQDLINGQRDKDFFIRTIHTVQSKIGILGKRGNRNELQQPQLGQGNQNNRFNQEEEKNNEEMIDAQDDDVVLSEDDKQLIEIYGPKIRCIQWFFENDKVVKDIIGNNKNIRNNGGFGMINFDDDYGEEEAIKPVETNYEFFKGIGFTLLDEESSIQIETAYQMFLKTKKPQETYIQSGDDIYQIKFDISQNGRWKITNTSTQFSRQLKRRDTIKGPFIETKEYQWHLIDNGQEIPAFEKSAQKVLTKAYEKCISKQKNVAQFITVNKSNHIFAVEYAKKEQPLLIDLQSMNKFKVTKKEKVTRWDYIQTFKPPAHLSIELGQIWQVEKLQELSAEYQMVAKAFNSTYNGAQFGVQAGSLMFANPIGGAGIFGVGPAPLYGNIGGKKSKKIRVGGIAVNGSQPKIKKIEKVFNCMLYDKFINEFKRMLRKYPNKQISDLMKHLFHGTNQTDPKLIYQSEDGLDIRFSNAGAYGNGIYFANNSAYSHSFTHRSAGGVCQMFMCLVLVGDSVQLPPGQYRIPPNKPKSTTERYDSVNNGPGGHFIVYDNSKCYPGYVISYH